MTNLPPSAAALLSSLRAEEIDRERILTWASCGFNCAAAARARPDLGSADAFEDAKGRHEDALAAALRSLLRESRSPR